VSIAEAVAIAARRVLLLVGVLPPWRLIGMEFLAAPVCIGEQASVGAALSRWRFSHSPRQ
jgi:hypothetical protein